MLHIITLCIVERGKWGAEVWDFWPPDTHHNPIHVTDDWDLERESIEAAEVWVKNNRPNSPIEED